MSWLKDGEDLISNNVRTALQVEGTAKAKAPRWESTGCSGSSLAGTQDIGETSYAGKTPKGG